MGTSERFLLYAGDVIFFSKKSYHLCKHTNIRVAAASQDKPIPFMPCLQMFSCFPTLDAILLYLYFLQILTYLLCGLCFL